MSLHVAPKLVKLEDDPIWVESCSLAEHIYGLLHLLPEEEKWNTATKLRNSCNDMMYFAAQAVGNSSPGTGEYEWGSVRKQASALKTMYRFAGKQKFIDLDPEIMVRLNKLLAQIDKQVLQANKDAEAYNEAEIALWRKKYETWKEINK